MHLRRISWSLVGLSLLGLSTLALVIGLCLPRRSEVRRSAILPAPPSVVHGSLAALASGPAWCTWEPATRPAGPQSLQTTASLESRGVWFDVPSVHGVRKAALLLAPVPAGTRVEWFDVLHLPPLNPIASLSSLTRERRIGAQIEDSLEALRKLLAPK